MKSLNCRQLVATLILGCCTFAAAAQTKPNLTGTWKVNLSKSKLTNEGLLNLVERFEQQGSTLRESLTTTKSTGTSTVNYSYSLDGKEIVNLIEGDKVRTTAKWDGSALVLEWNDEGGTFKRQFTLSDNGNTLTVTAHDASADGETNDLLVLERQ
jgi:hypothetical protein